MIFNCHTCQCFWKKNRCLILVLGVSDHLSHKTFIRNFLKDRRAGRKRLFSFYFYHSLCNSFFFFVPRRSHVLKHRKKFTVISIENVCYMLISETNVFLFFVYKWRLFLARSFECVFFSSGFFFSPQDLSVDLFTMIS